MDEDLEKQNKKLQEDPDDFAVKNHIFTQESMVSFVRERERENCGTDVDL